MQLLCELNEWCLRAAMEFEDPSEAVGQIFARFSTAEPQADGEILARWRSPSLLITMPGGWLPIEIDPRGAQVDEESGELKAFGARQICPGFWTLAPSLNIPGQIHVFVHIYDVPAIAPWERRIILPPGVSAF